MDQADRTRVTLPALARMLGITRARAERLVTQYADRLGPCERYGIVRSWPEAALDTLRTVLTEEARLREQRT